MTEQLGLGVLRIRPGVHRDDRGAFSELWRATTYGGLTGEPWVQENVSTSGRHVLRGLHYQFPNPQAKLISVLRGVVFDVAVDIRGDSPTFGQWVGTRLDGEEYDQLFVPSGFAHGFVVLSDEAVFHYKCSAFYDPAADSVIRWNDPAIGIEWPVEQPVLSWKDAQAPALHEIDAVRLPRISTRGQPGHGEL